MTKNQVITIKVKAVELNGCVHQFPSCVPFLSIFGIFRKMSAIASATQVPCSFIQVKVLLSLLNTVEAASKLFVDGRNPAKNLCISMYRLRVVPRPSNSGK